MTRKKVLNGLKQILDEESVIFCVGEGLVNEVDFSDMPGLFTFSNEHLDVLSVAVGVAIATERRVFVITEDSYVLRHFASILQAAVSKCSNLFFIVLVTTQYTVGNNLNTLFNYLRSVKGILFSSGMLTHDYTAYFETKASLKKVREVIRTSRGPAVGLINISNLKTYGSFENNNNHFLPTFLSTPYKAEPLPVMPGLNLDTIMAEN